MDLNTRQLSIINLIWVLISLLMIIIGLFKTIDSLIFIGTISFLFSMLILVIFSDFKK